MSNQAANEEQYYVHRKRDFLGNAPMWWAKGGRGYTAYILGAERFSKQEAEEMLNHDPEKWAIYKCSEVDKRLHLVFDIQDACRLGTDEPCGWPSGYAPHYEELLKQRDELLSALLRMTERYVSLVECGDCGNWNPENEEAVTAAREAIAKVSK
jgi:hypothetical protein